MSQANVWFAIKDSHYQLLLDNFRVDANGDRVRTDLTVSQARKLRDHVTGHWKTPEIAGNIYHVISWTIPIIYVNGNPANGLLWVEFLTNKWPNIFIILCAWNTDGTQFGVSVEYDTDGNEIVTGTPFYPVHSQILKVIPDDVVYDQGGTEISRTPATEPKDVNLILGWNERRWP